MLRDIRACVEDESATGPWYAVRHSPTRFAIFEAFPDIAGRDDTSRENGDIFRDVKRPRPCSEGRHSFRKEGLRLNPSFQCLDVVQQSCALKLGTSNFLLSTRNMAKTFKTP